MFICESSTHCTLNWYTEEFDLYWSNDAESLIYYPRKDAADVRHGPAYIIETNHDQVAWSATDAVLSIRLLGWPTAAQSWICRERRYAWPCNAIVTEVQRNGSDLVSVSHRDYKLDIFQFRYFYSRAEVILIRSWTQIQQIVYHMLRYFAKLTIIRECENDDKVICTYHTNTLMLWSCERKSPDWWESSCVLDLCSKLLHTLMEWIRRLHCPHYFIPEWNLFDFAMKETRCVHTVENIQNHANIRHLTEWFRVNYVSKVFSNYLSLLATEKDSERQRVLNVVASSNLIDKKFYHILQEWVIERNSNLHLFFHVVVFLQHLCADQWNAQQLSMLISSKKLASQQPIVLDRQLLNMAVASLRLAWNVFSKSESEISNHDLLNVLCELVLRLPGHDTCNGSTPFNISFKQCSKWYFIKGVRLLSTYCEKHSAAYVLWVKTCKRYFKSALSIQDEYSETINDACHVYLSALYYVSETNQDKPSKHLMQAKNGSSSSDFFKPYIVSYSTLLFVDTVAHVCGFCFLFNHFNHI